MIANLTDRTIRQNPYPLYAQLRQTNPVVKIKMPFVGEVWAVTRYADVMEGLKHPALSTDIRATDSRLNRLQQAWWMPKVLVALQQSMINRDDPDHRRLRNLVHQAFTPRRVEQMTDRMGEIVATLLDRVAQERHTDLIATYALPLPLTVIAEMMGVTEADRERFHQSSSRLLELSSNGALSLLRHIPTAMRLMRFFEELIKQRRLTPGTDLVTALVQAEADGERLSHDEIASMIFLLLLAGHETTVNLIGTGMLALLQHPDQLHLLREQPDLIDTAIEELLRFGNPVEHGSMRHATADLELGGQQIARGSVVLLLLASANRDETIFERADELDITRNPNRHVGFGFGIHYCLGAPLARIEARLAILGLLERFPNLRLAVPPEQLVWRNSLAVRGLRALPISIN